MDRTGPFESGAEYLAQYLASNRIVLADLTLDAFREWLLQRIAEHATNDVFQQKCRIRDLVREHRSRLQRRETIARSASRAYASAPQAAAIERSERQLVRLRKAVAGLDAAVREGRAERAKLATFRRRLTRQQRRHAELIADCLPKQRLDRAEASLARLREEIGLAHEEGRLLSLQRSRGRRSGVSGSRFEELAAMAIDQHIIPQLSVRRSQLVRLQRVTLGCARGEFDQLIVMRSPKRETVDVVAMIEAKRNPNDAVDGFNMRQENLAWFTGDASGYDPARYRTRAFPTGHFDRPSAHEEHGTAWRFDRRSFARFRRDAETGHFLSGLFFVTTSRPLLGLTSSQLAAVLHWVATDPEVDETNDALIERYRQRVLALAGPFQTRDVLELFLHAGAAEHIVFAAR